MLSELSFGLLGGMLFAFPLGILFTCWFYSDIVIKSKQELTNWRKYASYCRCCAESGEHNLLSYEDFLTECAEAGEGT